MSGLLFLRLEVSHLRTSYGVLNGGNDTLRCPKGKLFSTTWDRKDLIDVFKQPNDDLLGKTILSWDDINRNTGDDLSRHDKNLMLVYYWFFFPSSVLLYPVTTLR